MKPISERLLDSTEQLILGLIEGDLHLRRQSLDQLHRTKWLPFIHVCSEMRVKLSFILRLEKKKHTFHLFRKRFDDTVADIRLRLAIRPTPDRVPAVGGDPVITFVPPPFLDVSAGGKNQLVLNLKESMQVTIHFNSDNQATLVRPSGDVLMPSQKWSLFDLLELIESIGDWLAEPGTFPARPFQISTKTALGNLVSEIVEGLKRLETKTAEALSRNRVVKQMKMLNEMNAHYVGNYRLSGLRSDVLVQLDGKGELINRLDDPNWQQFDISAQWLNEAAHREVRLSIQPPDFLVKGEYHGRFLESIRQPSVSDQLRKAFEGFAGGLVEDIDRSGFRKFLEGPGFGRAIFIRLDRRDLELVLVEGDLQGASTLILFMAEFEVTAFPEVKVKAVKNIRMLAIRVGEKTMTIRVGKDSPVRKYFQRLFSVLRTWQLGMVQ